MHLMSFVVSMLLILGSYCYLLYAQNCTCNVEVKWKQLCEQYYNTALYNIQVDEKQKHVYSKQ